MKEGNGFQLYDFDGDTTLDLDPDKLLYNNIGTFTQVVLIGFDEEDRVVMASSFNDGHRIVTLLELAKQKTMDMLYG